MQKAARKERFTSALRSHFANPSGALQGSSLPLGPNSPTSSPMTRLMRSWKG